ncbi:MAG TPA: hypothetical protein VFZ65_01195 [Planctomycetota bacterium]|nr:hypothetical protein [Planctomycetota bacterium]
MRVHASLKGGLARVVGRALAADRDRRYGSVGEFTRALRREIVRHQRRRWCGQLALAAAAAAAAGFGAACLALG